MDLDHFQALGQTIASEIDKPGGGNFSKKAAKALKEFHCNFKWDSGQLASFLTQSSVPQQPNVNFSNFPLTVYQHRDFYIELLTWTQGTTTIHQHSFSGAFRVLQGASIHSKYQFNQEQAITEDLLRGRIDHIESEYLSVDDIREIRPGKSGLTHRLFHLEKPSVTLVARTYGNETFLPQYRILEPCFAYNDLKYQNDSLVTMLKKLIHVTNTLDHCQAADILTAQVSKLDFPRLLAVYLGVYKLFTEEAELPRFYEAARNRHGRLADDLIALTKNYNRLNRLLKSRNATEDPELRFFLALLLNLPDRKSLVALVRQRYPNQNPKELCADWLVKLSSQKENLSLRLAQLASQSEATHLHLGARVGSSIANLATDDIRREFFEGLFDINFSHPPPESEQRLRQWATGLNNIKDIDELAAIFR